MGTRRPEVDSSLPHVVSPSRRQRRTGVAIPFIHYINRNRMAADEFIRRQFVNYRVTAIGEQHHAWDGYEGRRENICVRLFLQDLVLRLYQDREETRLKFLVLECDEAQIMSELGYHWSDRSLSDTSTYPSGTQNRSAYWFAQSFPRGRSRSDNPNLALMEALLSISRTCGDAHLEVVGIDDFTERERLEDSSNIEEFQVAHERREELLASRLNERVLQRLGDDRALIYYGMDHLQEADIDPEDDARLTNQSFLQRLAASGGTIALAPEDVYTVAACYDLTQGPESGVNAMCQQNVPVDQTLVRIYDMLRAEFPDEESLGFDIDEAENNAIMLHLGLQNTLGEVFDGYLFFRDTNSWNGSANLPEADRTSRSDLPHFRVSRVVPSVAYPGNTVFIYGHFFPSEWDITVSFGTYESPNVEIRNENLLAAEVPEAVGAAGTTVDIEISRVTSLAGQHYVFSNGFQFHYLSYAIF